MSDVLSSPSRSDGATQSGDMTTGQGPEQPCPLPIPSTPTVGNPNAAARIVGDIVTGAGSKPSQEGE